MKPKAITLITQDQETVFHSMLGESAFTEESRYVLYESRDSSIDSRILCHSEQDQHILIFQSFDDIWSEEELDQLPVSIKLEKSMEGEKYVGSDYAAILS